MIEVQQCVKRYGNVVAVNGVSFTVKKSEIFGLLGPNGAGKSTTIKMMVGLMRPDSGRVKVGGYDIGEDPVNAKRMIAYVPEKAFLYEKLTAWEYVSFIGGLYSLDQDTLKRNAEEYLELFGLLGWRDALVGGFSMGMKQRLALASAMMRDPEVIILDEPHNGLDPKGVRLLKDTLYRQRDAGKTVILSTHIIAIAEEICDRIAIINEGSLVADGSNEDLRRYAKSSDRTLEDIFLRLTSGYDHHGDGE